MPAPTPCSSTNDPRTTGQEIRRISPQGSQRKFTKGRRGKVTEGLRGAGCESYLGIDGVMTGKFNHMHGETGLHLCEPLLDECASRGDLKGPFPLPGDVLPSNWLYTR